MPAQLHEDRVKHMVARIVRVSHDSQLLVYERIENPGFIYREGLRSGTVDTYGHYYGQQCGTEPLGYYRHFSLKCQGTIMRPHRPGSDFEFRSNRVGDPIGPVPDGVVVRALHHYTRQWLRTGK